MQPAERTAAGERIVSRCGLYCDTCPAFHQGLCNGCPSLGLGECVVRDCAHLKTIDSCHDCELESCYHFEAYTVRRQLMRERTKALLTRYKALGITVEGSSGGCGSGGCGSGGCGSGGCGSGGASGGCAGCSSAGSCGVAKVIEALIDV